MDFREQRAQLERVSALAELEEEYVQAREAYREKDTPARREKFKEAKEHYDQARVEYRDTEVAAGRRTVGVSVSNEGAE